MGFLAGRQEKEESGKKKDQKNYGFHFRIF
jgi:hypothetical protein